MSAILNIRYGFTDTPIPLPPLANRLGVAAFTLIALGQAWLAVNYFLEGDCNDPIPR